MFITFNILNIVLNIGTEHWIRQNHPCCQNLNFWEIFLTCCLYKLFYFLSSMCKTQWYNAVTGCNIIWNVKPNKLDKNDSCLLLWKQEIRIQ